MRVTEADWPKVKKNLEFMTRMTFLFSLYDLGAWKSMDLLMRLRTQFGDFGMKEVFKLWAQGRVAPIADAKLRQAMMADLHRRLSLEIDLDDFTLRGALRNMDALGERVQRAMPPATRLLMVWEAVPRVVP